MALDLTTLLAFAKEQGASDLHISAGQPPLLRLRGQLVRLEMPALTRDDARAAIYDILNDEQKRVFEERRDIDFALDLPGVSRFRANIMVQERGLAAVFRVIPTQIKTLEELGMPPVLKELASKERGLVVITGPTGSGKSTTLA
ncbi:MAG TPA: ATPase, T2SS/T4P/T4SS family, partial [Candidatus Eisenbacteria bacterium]|nr:ATPase, T2SS/T4P/T4SS family [Candidatus Eisenbacteria bacterium]